MAIRPSDLQGGIFQASQTASISQRAEDGPRQAAQAAQAAFAAQVTQREETIESTSQAEGNRVTPNPDRRPDDDRNARRRRRNAGDPFEEIVDDAAGFDEPPHLIDFSA